MAAVAEHLATGQGPRVGPDTAGGGTKCPVPGGNPGANWVQEHTVELLMTRRMPDRAGS